jgi:hypothetical protein
MINTVFGHPTIVFADNEFVYDKVMQKLYRLDERKNLFDLTTSEWIGSSLLHASLANTPGYEIKAEG